MPLSACAAAPVLDEKKSARCRFLLGLAAAVFFLAALRGFVSYISANRVTQFDDAYMFLRYARNLLDGRGICWNPGGPPTFGVSSLLYLFQIAGLMKITGASGSGLLAAASLANAAAACLVMAASARKIVRLSWLKSFFFLAAVITGGFMISVDLRYQARSGMDTTLAMLTNAALVYAGICLFEKPRARNAVLTAFAAYLTYLCRSDNFIYALAFPVLGILLLQRSGRTRALLIFAGVFFLLVGLDAAAKGALFGDVLPLPAHVKKPGFYVEYFSRYFINPVLIFNSFLLPCFPLFALLLIGRPLKYWKVAAVFLLPVAVTSVILFNAVQIMGVKGRFYMPGLPFVAAAALSVFDKSFEGVRPFSRECLRHFLVRGACVLVLFLAGPPLLDRAQLAVARRQNEALYSTPYDLPAYYFLVSKLPGNPNLNTWWSVILTMNQVVEKLPRGALLAATEDGYISARNPGLRILDMNGLHEPYIAHHGFSAAYVLDQKPDLIWLPHWDYIGSIKGFWSLPRFWEDYEYYPRGFRYGIALRKSSPHYAAIKEAVAEGWPVMHPSVPMASELTASPEELRARIDRLAAGGIKR
ncbi:MAG TPA: hypothetical protein VL688_01980 [Verrucomicrobiae bacterium]|nr:hypothetical protein [Verrucomicrobiae bacterium]